MPTISLIGTCDTKLHELLRLRQYILDFGCEDIILIDVGREQVNHDLINISHDEVLKCGNESQDVDLMSLPRGKVIQHMIGCAKVCVDGLFRSGKICAMISAGGSGGTSLAAAVMRETLPIGFPKLIISTVASGDTGPLIGETDITMMYSVVDIAGSNALLDTIFRNGASAIVGMSRAWARRQSQGSATSRKTRIGITMFGVTTPCVDAARRHLEENLDAEIYVFHATGHGGKAMERLVADGELDAVLDITTTEICDLIAGGCMSAGSQRLEAAAKAGIPYVLSAGATDMVNFPEPQMVPPQYKSRKLFEHNPTVTLMRTSPAECKAVGGLIAKKLRDCAKSPEKIEFVIPHGGVSIISTPGGPFEDQAADAELFAAIHDGLKGTGITVIDDERAINDTGFARSISQRLIDLLQR